MADLPKSNIVQHATSTDHQGPYIAAHADAALKD